MTLRIAHPYNRSMVKVLSLFLVLTSLSALGSTPYCFDVDGMTCSQCVKKIKEAFSEFSYLESTKVSLKEASVTILSKDSLSPAQESHLLKTFKDLKYKAKKVKCASSP